MTLSRVALATESVIDEREFRHALGRFATGVTVITTVGEDSHRYGMTANSFAAVSLKPPLVLWSLATSSPSAEAYRNASHFAVNILALDQLHLSRHFAHPHPDKFSGIETVAGLGGAPLLTGCAATFECRREFAYFGGDHVIIVGRVERFAYQRASTLIFCQGHYQRGVDLEPAANADAELSAAWSGLA